MTYATLTLAELFVFYPVLLRNKSSLVVRQLFIGLVATSIGSKIWRMIALWVFA